MRDLFNLAETSRLVWEKYMLNLNIPVHNQVTSGSKSLRVFWSKVWKSLPYHIKSSKNLKLFKMITKYWNGTRHNCKVCNHHKIKKSRDCLSKANLGLLRSPGCTTFGCLLIIARCYDVDVMGVTNYVSGFCTQILYSF